MKAETERGMELIRKMVEVFDGDVDTARE